MDETWIGCATPNFRPGRNGGAKPEAVVVHIIVGSLTSAGNTFRNPNISPHRSAHYGVGRDGRVHRYVHEEDTAFHAGILDRPTAEIVRSKGRMNPNLYTLGIEHEGFPGDVWPAKQVETSAALVARCCARWGITCDRQHVIMHREIRASKTCPGLSEEAMRNLIEKARNLVARSPAAGVVTPGTRITEGFPRVVRVTRRVNLRSGNPAVTSPIMTVLPTGAEVKVVALVHGDTAINGQPWWCELAAAKGYVWAGAVDLPA